MTAALLVDSNVLIDALRHDQKAQQFLRDYVDDILLSVITLAELFAGVRNRKEEKILRDWVSLFPKTGISEAIAERAGVYRYRYGKSHNMGMVDAIIAATVEVEGARLVTLNKKHFPMIKDVWVPYKKA